jgi:hypothetical protein
MSFEPPARDALFRLLVYARDEAREQELPLVEYLLGVAMEDVGDSLLRHNQSAREGEVKRT